MILRLLPVVALLVAPAWPRPRRQGRRAKAIACQACHGLDGVSKLPDAPNLSGQVEPYLVKALTSSATGRARTR